MFLLPIYNVITGKPPFSDPVSANVLAPAIRIVTDTAIDVADLATGTQFHDDMTKAKTGLDDAGIPSTATQIKENFYPQIKTLEDSLATKQKSIADLQQKAGNDNAQLQGRIDIYNGWVRDVKLIQQLQEECNKIISALEDVSRKNFPIKVLDNQIKIEVSSDYEQKMDALKYTNISLGAISTVTTVISLAAKTAELASVASKASVVLTIVGIGIDIGMTVVQLEEQQKELQSQNQQADDILNELNKNLSEIQKTRIEVDAKMREILEATSQTETSFSSWAETKIKELTQAIENGKIALRNTVVNTLTPLVKDNLDESVLIAAARGITLFFTDEELKAIIVEIKSKG